MFPTVYWRIVKLFLIALLVSSHCFAQKPLKEKEYQWVRGIRIGCDVSRFGVPFFQKGRKATEFSIDTEIKRNLTPTFELGFENSNINNDRLGYNSNGAYGRIGLDYNILKQDDPTNRHSFFLGFRYGFAASKQTTNWNIENGYFGTSPSGFSSDIIGSHWMELVVGLKVEVLKNLFLGWSLRGKILFSSTPVDNQPFAIPGFGNGENKTNLGLNYSIYYSIPIMKVKGKVKLEE